MTASQIQTKPEIATAFASAANEDLQFWSGFSPAKFLAPIGAAWSPSDNVRHLIMATRPVAKALGTPKLTLRMVFGKAENPSRTFDELHEAYLALLAQGANAGKFAPAPEAAPEDPARRQAELIDELLEAIDELAGKLDKWDEDDLDGYVLPHPLLGKLTIREILYFTLFHYQHHQNNVTRRLREQGQ